MTDLTGKTALVTGSVQGIGLAIARALAGAGARVAVHGLADKAQAKAALDAVTAAGAPKARFFDADMRDVAAIEAMMATLADWGGVDILVCFVGCSNETVPWLRPPTTTTATIFKSANWTWSFPCTNRY